MSSPSESGSQPHVPLQPPKLTGPLRGCPAPSPAPALVCRRLSGNRLSHVPGGAFSGLHSLKIL